MKIKNLVVVNSFLTLILKLSNLTHLIKININMNLSIQSLTFYLLFFIFHEKETFQKLWKIVFISSNKHLSRWIPNPGVPYSKPLCGSKVDSAFHPSEVDKMSTRNFWEFSGKK